MQGKGVTDLTEMRKCVYIRYNVSLTLAVTNKYRIFIGIIGKCLMHISYIAMNYPNFVFLIR